ncbi:hypothetical protein V8B97DRAFT_374871 [Scleroderma yunnanense]
MAYNQFQPSNQSQAHTFQHSSYPPAGSSTPTSPLSSYSMPSQSYDPRWYQRPSQQPSGFQYTNKQGTSYSQQRIEPLPQLQPFRQITPAQSGFSASRVRPPSTSPNNQDSYYTLLPAGANPASPLPPSSFHLPSSYTRQAQSNTPFASPTSPPICSRRPLPTPKPRPESLPPPPRHTPQIQAPAPSRPAILTHSTSFASIEPPSSLSSPSSTTSSNGSRRPLPTPQQRCAKHTSLDLRARPSSPVKPSIAEQLLPSLSRLPSKPSMQNALGSDGKSDGNTSPTTSTQVSIRNTADDAKPSGPPSPTKFVPHWRRELQKSPSLAGNVIPAVERRSTVSGQSAPKMDTVHDSDPSDSLRRDLGTHTSPTRRPLPSPQKGTLSTGRAPAHIFATPSMYTSVTSEEIYLDTDEEEPMVFANPEDGTRTPSPQYGIRDLPQRSRTVIANRENVADSVQQNGVGAPTSKDVSHRARPVRSATLPLSPPPVPPQNSRGPASNNTSTSINNRSNGGQSLTFRLAAMSLAEGPSSSTHQLPTSRLPGNVPPPARIPTTQSQSLPSHVSINMSAANVNSVGASHSAVAQNPPSPEKSLPSPTKDTYNTRFHQMSERQREKQREFVDLDDAPPPSLHRSPSPIRPSSNTLPSVQISGSPPQRQWTPSKSSRAGSPNRSKPSSLPTYSPTISISSDSSNGTISGPSISVSAPTAPSISVSSSDPPAISFSPQISVLDPTLETQPPRGRYGSRHTQVQESHPKRTLPPLPQRAGLFCGGCGGSIMGRIVSAMGMRWHPGCFRCSICNELLEHVSSYEHEGKPYCHLDYHEAFAPRCFHCKTAIIDERFITLDDPGLGKRTYHEQHFFCAECGDPFLAPSGTTSRTGELNVSGDGEFEDDNVCFTVYKGHPYCEACHVRLRMPKCKSCKRSIRDGMHAVEALGGKWCWECFVCASCEKPFDDPAFFLRDNKPFCEPCFSLMLKNEV